jgi:trehalose utilization protein
VAKNKTFERKEFFDAYDKLMNHPKFSQKKALENIEKRGLHLATYATSGDYYRALLHFINVKE